MWGGETVTVSGYDSLLTAQGAEYDMTTTATGATMVSKMEGHHCDNPKDARKLEVVDCMGLVVDQHKRSFMMLFKDTDSFEVTFYAHKLTDKKPKLPKERNFLFGGHTNFVQPCPEPPTTTTTTATTVVEIEPPYEENGPECLKNAATFHFEAATVSENNLGDQGPAAGPPRIRYDGVGTLLDGETFDMIVETLNEDYVAEKPEFNGIRVNAGQINVKAGHEAHVKFTLVKHNSTEPITLPAFYISVFDIDQDKWCGETVTVSGYDSLLIAQGAEYDITATAHGATMVSKMEGHHCDNPKEPRKLEVVDCMGMVVDQHKRSFMMAFKDTISFEMILRAQKVTDEVPRNDDKERNFLFGGHTNFVQQCPEPHSTTTTTTTTTHPCIPDVVVFNFENAKVTHSNLGGAGPDDG